MARNNTDQPEKREERNRHGGLRSLEWIERLVREDTVSAKPNIGVIELLRDHVQAVGALTYLTTARGGQWANLFATIPAHDGSTQGGIVLSGHTDVVPVAGQAWASDPFRPEIRDGRLYGRGTCDMKGFIGVVMSSLDRIVATPLEKPVHFAWSFDEEVGCAGAPLMIGDLQKRGIFPDGCIVGEPTSMRPVVAHKGINAYRCCINGKAAHSSLTPTGSNAIEYAARLVCYIRDMADRFKAEGPFDMDFDVPFSTAQTSTIAGGNAINTVPDNCEFTFEFRNLPTVDPQRIIGAIREHAASHLLPKMQREFSGASIDIDEISVAPSLDDMEAAAITKLVQSLTRDAERRKVAYGTEAGLFASIGIPTVICGPGDIRQAHRPDEYVELDQIADCEVFMDKLVDSMTKRI